MLSGCSALLNDGHFVHGHMHRRQWFNPLRLTANPIISDRLARAMRERWHFDLPQVIVAAAPRAMILGHHLALHFSLRGLVVEFIYLEETTNGYVFPPHHADHVRGKLVLIFDDAIRTGKTAQAMIKPVEKAGAHVLGVTTVIDCCQITPLELGVNKIISLYRFDIEEYEAPCPMCEAGIRINTDFGDGQKYLDEQRDRISALPA